MKTKVVNSEDVTPARGLRARDYISGPSDVSDIAWGGVEQVAEACFKTAKSKGWWDGYEGREMTPDEIASKLCLIHSEVSEALEDVREGRMEPRVTHDGKPVGFPSELADIVIRVFDLCGFLEIDIADAIELKMAHNEKRAFKHGGKKI